MAISDATRLADFGSGIGTQGAVLKVDNTNSRIGIGTTFPQSTLQVGQFLTVDDSGINIVAGIGGVKESIMGMLGKDSRLTDVAMGNIVNTTHIGNIINSTGPFGTATEIKQTALGGVEITAGFGAWVFKMSATGIEFGDAIGVNQIKMGLTGLTISSPKIDIPCDAVLSFSTSLK